MNATQQTEQKETFYLVDQEGFKGNILSSGEYDKDGVFRVHYTNGLTLEQYQEERGIKVIVLNGEQTDKLFKDFENGMKTKPKEIKEEDYFYALEVLPPCRYSGNSFYVSERIRGNLVNWYFKKNGKFYEFIDDANITKAELNAIILAA